MMESAVVEIYTGSAFTRHFLGLSNLARCLALTDDDDFDLRIILIFWTCLALRPFLGL